MFCSLPEGYTMGILKPEHSVYISQYWKYFDNWDNKVSYLRACIQNYPSAAVFAIDNDELPVSWALMYHVQELGFLYTLETHRRKGLGMAVMTELFISYQNYSVGVPFLSHEEDAPYGIFEKLGFVDVGPFQYLFLES